MRSRRDIAYDAFLLMFFGTLALGAWVCIVKAVTLVWGVP